MAREKDYAGYKRVDQAAEVLRRLIRDLENSQRPGGGDPVPPYVRQWQRENRK
jgi:hypothetical protein